MAALAGGLLVVAIVAGGGLGVAPLPFGEGRIVTGSIAELPLSLADLPTGWSVETGERVDVSAFPDLYPSALEGFVRRVSRRLGAGRAESLSVFVVRYATSEQAAAAFPSGLGLVRDWTEVSLGRTIGDESRAMRYKIDSTGYLRIAFRYRNAYAELQTQDGEPSLDELLDLASRQLARLR